MLNMSLSSTSLVYGSYDFNNILLRLHSIYSRSNSLAILLLLSCYSIAVSLSLRMLLILFYTTE